MLLVNEGSRAWDDLDTYAGDDGVQLMLAKSEDVEELAKPAVIEDILQAVARGGMQAAICPVEDCHQPHVLRGVFQQRQQIQAQRVGG